MQMVSFNPRPREEGDIFLIEVLLWLPCFNPRPREEGDVNGILTLFSLLCFNPRPREEGDYIDVTCKSE